MCWFLYCFIFSIGQAFPNFAKESVSVVVVVVKEVVVVVVVVMFVIVLITVVVVVVVHLLKFHKD